MKSLKKQSKKHTLTEVKPISPSITNKFDKPSLDVLGLIINKPMQFKDYSESMVNVLAANFQDIARIVGIKEVLDISYCHELAGMIINEYPNFTAPELKIAVRMGVMGKYPNFDNNHYQQLSPQYISSMIVAYKTHRSNIYSKYKMLQDSIRREEEPKKVSKKDMFYEGLSLVEAEYKDYLENPKGYMDSKFRTTQFKYIYEFLTKHKLIEPKSFKDDSELKRYVVSWYRAIKNLKSTPREYICGKYKIPLYNQ